MFYRVSVGSVVQDCCWRASLVMAVILRLRNTSEQDAVISTVRYPRAFGSDSSTFEWLERLERIQSPHTLDFKVE